MSTITLSELRRLSDLASRASAALIPLASDGVGADSHGGTIRDPRAALERALDALIRAGALASRMRSTANHPDRGDDLVGLAGRGNFSGPGTGGPDSGDSPTPCSA